MAAGGFGSLGLDPRLVQHCKKKGFKVPTAVQCAAIPALLNGKDVVAMARTGTGKTLAYLLPLLHTLVEKNLGKQGWEALVLVPTRELCLQVYEVAEGIIKNCKFDIKATSLNLKGNENLELVANSAGSIVVATPGQIVKLMDQNLLTAAILEKRLTMLVVDEADLLLSFGYGKDLSALAPKIPRSCQCILVSATKGADLDNLQKLLLHNPVNLDLVSPNTLTHPNELEDPIDHQFLACFDEDRLLSLLVLLKMNLVKRRVLVFVNSIYWAYKTRLFLEAFGISSMLLHSEMPLNSRHHILKQFRKGVCQHMIVADDTHAASIPVPNTKKKRKRGQSAPEKFKKDEEFGVTRGVDFEGVATVVNLELPDSPEGYIHRVGRTGRGGKKGTAVTFFTSEDSDLKGVIEEMVKSRRSVQGSGKEMLVEMPVHIALHMEALRVRSEDVVRGVTKNVIKEARIEDVKKELLKSERLESHFAAHPKDLTVLQHTEPLTQHQNRPHLSKPLPGYIVLPEVPKLQPRKGKQRWSKKNMKADPLAIGSKRKSKGAAV